MNLQHQLLLMSSGPLSHSSLSAHFVICLPSKSLRQPYWHVRAIWTRLKQDSLAMSLVFCRRIDDPIGPLLMMLVFIAAMVAILLVNVVDLYLILKYEEKQSGEDAGDVMQADIPGAYC